MCRRAKRRSRIRDERAQEDLGGRQWREGERERRKSSGGKHKADNAQQAQITKDYYKPYLAATEPIFIKPREVKFYDRMEESWTL